MSNRCILIIDDNTSTLQLVRRIICHLYPDATVHAISNSEAAFDRAREYRPDLLITDLEMPALDGYELIEVLKHDQNTQHIPIVLLTSHADHARDWRIQRELEIRGFEDIIVLNKPIDLPVFKKVIFSLLPQHLDSAGVSSLQTIAH